VRFRAKFGWVDWVWIVTASVVTVAWVIGRRSSTLFLFVFGLNALIRIVSQVFVYWDVDSSSLREHRLWSTKEVAWQEVARVGLWTPKSTVLEIEYARDAPLSDRGTVIANPGDREQFLAAIHRFAPQAAFEL
jgi:hypothetical protein